MTATGQTHIIGVGEYHVTCEPGAAVKTLALGSCIAVCVYSEKTPCVGMAHIALPDSKVHPERAKELPAYFADTGLPVLFDALQRLCHCRANQCRIKLVGGAQMMDPNNTFNIGKRNALAIKKILWNMGMGPIAEDIGGTISRTVTIDVDTKTTRLTTHGRPDWTI